MSVFNLPIEMVGLRLARINRKDELILCEAVRFDEGVSAVDTILRRAAISGRVEVEGEIENYFADALDADGNMVTTIALDSRSYSALKNRWMRCRVERFEWMTTDQKPEIDSRIHPPSDPSADFAAAGEEVSYSEWAKAEARICHMIRETEPLEKIKEFDDFLWRYVVNTASTLDKAHATGWDAAIKVLKEYPASYEAGFNAAAGWLESHRPAAWQPTAMERELAEALDKIVCAYLSDDFARWIGLRVQEARAVLARARATGSAGLS